MTHTNQSALVTALVSTYRSEAFIEGCLQDLVEQTLYAKGALEIVVIDSGSPENERAIVERFQRQHPRIVYLRTERETLYAAWNRGIAAARGKYLTNANTDDRHRRDALEVMAAELESAPAIAGVYAEQLITFKPNDVFARTLADLPFSWPEWSYQALARGCIVGPQPMWRRTLHDRYGLFDARYQVAGDYEFWLRIGKTERLRKMPLLLGLYYMNRNGLEHSSEENTARETREIRERYGLE
jgi:glycosyltransferase involved in cell wall biosynthesis